MSKKVKNLVWEVALVLSSLELTNLFFSDLKKFNSTNFRTIEKAELTQDDATVHKAFSSVVTRYFIFAERHPEISQEERRVLYFKLKIDMIAEYFSKYPDVDLTLLQPFQHELRKHVRDTKGGNSNEQPSGTIAV